MPDIGYAGGYRGMLEIGRVCDWHGIAFSPHNPTGPVAHLASVHLCAASPAVLWLEHQWEESPLFDRLIGADPGYYLRKKLAGWSSGLSHFDPRALAEYERCFADPATIYATCEDYRAAATLDLEQDPADVTTRVECPLLAPWGTKGVVNRLFDPVADWKSVALDVRGKALQSGHFLAEEAPEQTLVELRAFFDA